MVTSSHRVVHCASMKTDVQMLRHSDGRWAAAIWQPRESSYFVYLWSTASEAEAKEIADHLRFAIECNVATRDGLISIVGSRPSETIDGADSQAWARFEWQVMSVVTA